MRFVYFAGALALLAQSALACRGYKGLDDGPEHEHAQAYALRVQVEYTQADRALMVLSAGANAYNRGIPNPIGGPRRRMNQTQIDAEVCARLNQSLDGAAGRQIGIDEPSVAKYVGDRTQLTAQRLNGFNHAMFYVPSVVEYLAHYEKLRAEGKPHQVAERMAREQSGGVSYSERRDKPPSWQNLRSLSEFSLPHPLDQMIAQLEANPNVPEGYREILFRYQNARKKHGIEPTKELIALVLHLNEAVPVQIAPPVAPRPPAPLVMTPAATERFYARGGSANLIEALEVGRGSNLALFMAVTELPKVRAADKPIGTFYAELEHLFDKPSIAEGIADKKPEAAREMADMLRVIARHTMPGRTFTAEELADARVARQILGLQ